MKFIHFYLLFLFLIILPLHLQAQNSPFQNPITLYPNVIIKDIEIADMDNDADKDLVFPYSQSISNNQIGIMRNLGNGTFSPPEWIDSLLTQTNDIEVGDIDNDGWLDIVAFSADSTHGLILYRNLLGTQFQKIPLNYGNASNTQIRLLYIQDIDQNGFNDITARITSTGQTVTEGIMVLYQQSPFSFTDSLYLIIEPYHYTLSDVNGDGWHDLIVASVEYLIYLNQNGIFVYDSLRSDSLNAQEPTQGLLFYAYLTELDTDKDLDLISYNTISSKFSIFENDGNGFFQYRTTLPDIVNFNFQNVRPLVAADLDSDSLTDLIFIQPQNGGIIYWAKNLGNFQFQSFVVTNGTGLNGVCVNLGFINADSCPDLVWAAPLTLHLNQCTVTNLDLTKELDVKVFPNSFHDGFSLQCGEKGTMTIWTTNGKRLYQQVFQPGRHWIQTDNWSPGPYFLSIETTRGMVHFLLLKY